MKLHSPRLVEGAQTQNGLVPHPHMMDRNSEGISQEWGVPDPYQALQPSSSAKKIKSPQPLATKISGDWVGERNWLSPKQFLLLKNPHMDSHTQTHSLPLISSTGASSLKGTKGIQGENEVSGIKTSRGHYPFSKASPHWASKLVPYLRLHQPG